FRQGDASPGRRAGGLGLGLAIVRQLAELHGGTIRAHSEGLGCGAMFTLVLHTTGEFHGTEETSESGEESAALSSSLGAPPEEGNLAGIRVLVVDDQTEAVELVERVLTERGALVTRASSAEEALERLDASAPDVLVADIGMPRSDGYELIRR